MEDERNSACLCHWHHGVASELWSKAWALSLAKAGELLLQNSSCSKANLQRHLVPIGRILVLIFPSYRCALTVQGARLKPFKI